MDLKECKNCVHCSSHKAVFENDIGVNALIEKQIGVLSYCTLDCDDFDNPDTSCRHFNDKELD